RVGTPGYCYWSASRTRRGAAASQRNNSANRSDETAHRAVSTMRSNGAMTCSLADLPTYLPDCRLRIEITCVVSCPLVANNEQIRDGREQRTTGQWTTEKGPDQSAIRNPQSAMGNLLQIL
ncbi:MAG TPA: hypothetical protein VGQ81_07065, partial [Acidobacteriota bacterium]|nr:hypothetical protein [Acidobacteriota bacterium]